MIFMKSGKKTGFALDQSNNDPAGRAEQLKESPGERWELLKATEDPPFPQFHFSFSRLEKLHTDENIAANPEKGTNYTGGHWRGGGGCPLSF